MSAQRTITVRRLRLAFPERLDPMLLPGQPELSYALVGLSLFLPYVEPYLIRTMSEAKHHLSDPELRSAISHFNGQEGQHSRMHTQFNALVRADCPALGPIEQELSRDFERFSGKRSLQWNLAYAEGFESLTSALAAFLLEEQTMRDAVPEVRDLFEWHIVEELEHRCVAYDVYQRLGGGYAYGLAVGLYAQRHLARFVAGAARALLDRDRERGIDHGGRAAARARLRPFLGRAAQRLLPPLLATYSPRYTPHRIVMPAAAEAVLQRIAA